MTRLSFFSRPSQGDKNHEVFSRYPHRIWPKWVNAQLDPLSPHYISPHSGTFSHNLSQRNWTTIRFPGSKELSTIDPSGLLTLVPGQWSLEFWVRIGRDLIVPSQITHAKQSYSSKSHCVQTRFEVNGLDICNDIFFKSLSDSEKIVFHQTRIKNTTSSPIDFSFYLAIRPYNPTGVATISKVVALSKNALIVNDKLGLILDQTPDNIVCYNFKDGDVNDTVINWEMIMSKSCPEGLGSAFVEYKRKLKGQESTNLSCKLPASKGTQLRPIFNQTILQSQRKQLLQKIETLKALNSKEEKTHLSRQWKETLERCAQIQLPDARLTQLYTQNVAHLHNLISDKTSLLKSPLGTLSSIVSALDGIGSHDHSGEILSQLPLFKTLPQLFFPRFSELQPLGHLTQSIYKRHLLKPDKALVQRFLKYTGRITKMIQGHYAKNGLLGGKRVSTDTVFNCPDIFWALSSIKRIDKLQKAYLALDEQNKYKGLFDSLSKSFDEICQYIADTSFKEGIIPLSSQNPFDSSLLDTLVSVYPHQLLSPKDPRVINTLKYIETNLLKNGRHYSSLSPVGYQPKQNCQLAQIYLAQRNPLFFETLNWISNMASDTGTWPEAIHPLSKGGSAGSGHFAGMIPDFLMLIRNMLIRETDTELELLPFVPVSWFEKEQGTIQFNRFPTRFGLVGLTLNYNGTQMKASLNARFRSRPRTIKLKLPFFVQKPGGSPIKAIALPSDGTSIPFQRIHHDHQKRPVLQH